MSVVGKSNIIEPAYISCGAGHLYDEHNFPGTAEVFGEVLARESAGDFVCNLFPAFDYRKSVSSNELHGPIDFMNVLLDRRAYRDGQKTGPASALFSIKDAVIRDRVLYARRQGRFYVVYETYRPIDKESSSLANLEELSNPHEGILDDTPVLFIGSTGDFNYGHWLSDDLTRLSAFWKVREAHPREHIVILMTPHGGAIDVVREQSIRFLLASDANFSIHPIYRDKAIAFQRVYYASPTTYFGALKSPEATSSLRSAALRCLSSHRPLLLRHVPLKKPSRRLFIDRGLAMTRRLSNATEVAELLRLRGFERHTLEGMDFKEQVELFSEATIVVGIMGAAMVNTTFCRERTPVMYLTPEGWDDPFFWDLATVLGHQHAAIYGTSVGDYHKGDFMIEVAVLDRFVSQLVTS